MKRVLGVGLLATIFPSGALLVAGDGAAESATAELREGSPAPSSWREAYDYVQDLRHQKAGPLLWGEQANDESIAQAINLLHGALEYLDRPIVRDLGLGSRYLRARRADVLMDLARAHALQGQTQRAVRCLSLASDAGASALSQMLNNEDVFAGLRDRPEVKRLILRNESEVAVLAGEAFQTPYRERLTPAEKIAGLSLFWTQARQHFAFFDQVPDLDWDHVYLESIPQVLEAETTFDYYQILRRLAPLLEDGHTNVYFPSELGRRYRVTPPVGTARIEGRVVVTGVFNESMKSSGVVPGVEILSIDGIPVEEYAQTNVRPFACSSTPQDAEVRIFTYDLLRGDRSVRPLVEWRDESGKTWESRVDREAPWDLPRDKANRFEMLDEDIAYLALDGFEDDGGLRQLLKNMPRIQQCQALILDIRRNGGGNSGHGYSILQHLVSEPFLTSKVRSRNQESLATARSPQRPPMDWLILSPSRYQPAEPTFLGLVVLLIGPRSFSAAEDFAVAFDASGRGTMIGRPTGGSTGQPLFLTLPGGGTARVCVKRDSYPDGREFVGVGVLPDIEIEPTWEDLCAGRDTELEEALRFLDEELFDADR